jgi:hypothetical protein
MGLSRSLLAVCALALGGCPTVSLGEVPPDIGLCNPSGGEDYFDTQIWPSYLAITDPLQAHTCIDQGCHGHQTFSGGLGFDETDPMSPNNYRAAQGELNCATPGASKLLIWPLAGIQPHGGGDLFRTTDPEYTTFNNWFQ